MRVLRLLGIAIAVCAAYLACYLFQWGNPLPAPSAWPHTIRPLAMMPGVDFLLRLSAQQIAYIVIALPPFAVALFAATTPIWHGENRRVWRAQDSDRAGASRSSLPTWLAPVVLIFAALASVATALLRPDGLVAAGGTATLVAAVSMAAYLGGVWAVQRRAERAGFRRHDAVAIRPYATWGWLTVALLLVGGIITYMLAPLPYLLDPFSLHHAALLQTQLADPTHTATIADWLRAPGIGTPGLGFLWLTTQIFPESSNALFDAGQMRAAIVAMGAIVALWLLAAELWRRTPALGVYHEPIDDDGALPTYLAVLLLPALPGFLHLARIPYVFEPVLWGLLGLWLLLIGLRKHYLVLVGLSALCVGSTIIYGSGALPWLFTSLLTWAGIALFQPAWLNGRWARLPFTAEPVKVETGTGKRAFLLWMLGLAIAAAPPLLAAVQNTVANRGRTLFAYLASTPWLAAQDATGLYAGTDPANWQPTLTPAIPLELPFAAQLLSVPFQLAGPLLSPLLILAVAALLMNLDHLTGWILSGWLLLSAGALVLLDATAPANLFWLGASLPAVALSLALTLDRIRGALLRNLGTWTLQATIYAALGLILAGLASNTIDYVQRAGRQHTPAAELVRRLPELTSTGVVYWVEDPAHTAAESQALTARLITMFSPAPEYTHNSTATAVQKLDPDALPATPPAGATFLVPGNQPDLLLQIQQFYGRGVVEIHRDARSDPVLYIYRRTPSPPQS